jgi:hypothetical protein
MGDGLLFGLVLLNSASMILAIYSGHATERGMIQGTFFIQQKAMVMGLIGLILAAGISLYRADFIDLVIVELITFFATSFLLGALGYRSQFYGVFGFWVGLLISLFA